MAGEVIDLLSSDSEGPVHPRATKEVAKNNLRGSDDLLYLSDELNAVVPTHSVWEGPSKRRRLSPLMYDDRNYCAQSTIYRPKQTVVPAKVAARIKPQGEQGWTAIEDSDPIIFTSSANVQTRPARPKSASFDITSSHGEDSDDSLPEDLLSAPIRSATTASALSKRTAAVLESLSQLAPRAKSSNARKRSGANAINKDKVMSLSARNGDHSAGPDSDTNHEAKGTKAARKPKLTEEERVAKAREKEIEKATKAKQRESAKAADKERRAKAKEDEQEQKRIQKEEKAREKRIAAELAEVNKSKLDKKDSTPEMIVDLPASINGQSLDAQIREFLKNLAVDVTLYQSSIPNVVKWRRKTKAKWNAKLDHWEPLEHMQVEDEKHVMCIMSAKEFVALAMVQNEDQDVETHVAKLKSAYDQRIPIYLIEGLQIWMRKNRTAENRAYQARVLNQGQPDQPAASKPKKTPAEVVDEDMLEDTLLRLQVLNGCLVHHTATTVETAEWVANFTEHISTIPYR